MASIRGSRPPRELLLTQREVAKTLCISLSAVKKMITQGILQPITPSEERQQLFYISDVAEVLKVVEDKVHLSKIWNRALVAYTVSRRVERKLDEVLELFGAKERRLPEAAYDI